MLVAYTQGQGEKGNDDDDDDKKGIANIGD